MSGDLCGFASCDMPNVTALRSCCSGELHSYEYNYHYCQPANSDTQNLDELVSGFSRCVWSSPAGGSTSGTFGIDCNRSRNGASQAANSQIGSVWVLLGLVGLLIG